MTATYLKPKASRKSRGVFSNLDIQEGDRIHFLGNKEIEVIRDGKSLCRAFCHDYELEFPELQKRVGSEKQLETEPGAGSKSEKKHPPIPPGARWITVGSDGEGDGHPVLIMPHPDGSATVIGGAGGSMNFLKLDRLKTPDQWRESARQRAKEKREKEAERVANQTEEQKSKEKEATEQVKEYKRTKQHDNAAKTLETLENLS